MAQDVIRTRRRSLNAPRAAEPPGASVGELVDQAWRLLNAVCRSDSAISTPHQIGMGRSRRVLATRFALSPDEDFRQAG
jgi:hypothetical protein